MAERLADGVWLLDLGWFPPFAANAYLVEDGDGLTLVDAGLPGDGRRLRREIRDAGHAVDDLRRVLLTHYDLDHVGGLNGLDDFAGPVYLGERDVRLVEGGWTPPLFHHKGAFHRAARRLFSLPPHVELRGVHEGDRVGGFTAYHTPGHNPGHTAYVHEELSVGLLGDLLWSQEAGLTPPFWLDSYDLRELRESVRRFADRAPPFDLLCVGHGDPVSPDASGAVRRLARDL